MGVFILAEIAFLNYGEYLEVGMIILINASLAAFFYLQQEVLLHFMVRFYELQPYFAKEVEAEQGFFPF